MNKLVIGTALALGTVVLAALVASFGVCSADCKQDEATYGAGARSLKDVRRAYDASAGASSPDALVWAESGAFLGDAELQAVYLKHWAGLEPAEREKLLVVFRVKYPAPAQRAFVRRLEAMAPNR